MFLWGSHSQCLWDDFCAHLSVRDPLSYFWPVCLSRWLCHLQGLQSPFIFCGASSPYGCCEDPTAPEGHSQGPYTNGVLRQGNAFLEFFCCLPEKAPLFLVHVPFGDHLCVLCFLPASWWDKLLWRASLDFYVITVINAITDELANIRLPYFLWP